MAGTDQLSIPKIGGAELSAPPSFLERYGFMLACATGVCLVVALFWALAYYILHVPRPPLPVSAISPTMSIDEYKAVVEKYQASTAPMRDAIGFALDWAVTRTTLPILTLLLGYVFGSKKS